MYHKQEQGYVSVCESLHGLKKKRGRQCVLLRQGRIIDKDMCNMEQQTRFDEEFKIITKQVDGVVDGDQMSRLRFKGVAL